MSDDFEVVVSSLAAATAPISVIAAAGCGKTEAIVRAVEKAEGRQLVLTHTNAGVFALRARFRKHKVSESKYRVETLASWLLKFAVAYSTMSGFSEKHPQGEIWRQVYPAALTLLNYPFLKRVLSTTYAGVFVDEYQDCTYRQHLVVEKLCEFLPVRVLGDPLQGIFAFRKDDRLVSWSLDVDKTFLRLPELAIPYRWLDTDPMLGEALAQIRSSILAGDEVDLQKDSRIRWYEWSEQREDAICRAAAAKCRGTVAGIHQWESDAHATARRVDGAFQSMEEMDCAALMDVARKIDSHAGNYIAISNDIKNIILTSCANRRPFANDVPLQNTISRVALGEMASIAEAVGLVLADNSALVFRRELLTELKRTAEKFVAERSPSFESAAYECRSKTRNIGRKLDTRLISRTLLIKGLEFDHAIVLNANKLQNKENWYVAVTRGTQNVIVLSSNPVFKWFA